MSTVKRKKKNKKEKNLLHFFFFVKNNERRKRYYLAPERIVTITDFYKYIFKSTYIFSCKEWGKKVITKERKKTLPNERLEIN